MPAACSRAIHADARCCNADANGSIRDPYRNSVCVIEASELDYAVIRRPWLNDRDEIDYDTTEKGEPFGNTQAYMSRKSVADLIVKLASSPELGRRSIGVNKTG